jgi:hypothetical protein
VAASADAALPADHEAVTERCEDSSHASESFSSWGNSFNHTVFLNTSALSLEFFKAGHVYPFQVALAREVARFG